MEKYLTTKEISKILTVREVTVRRWIKKGKLPAIRFGREYRVKRGDLEKYGALTKKVE
ncbi:helix-turn-helix domain-containing protein [Candidatus Gottesmanbacteria bacterium]|nr:helix-turn-helix domain-containing protein [Candidatus Gottesmanbacteria bacterium]